MQTSARLCRSSRGDSSRPRSSGAGGEEAEARGATKTPRARSTAARLADLQVLWGGRDRLLRVAEVAEQLAVGAWAVYRLCEDGDLAHVRINNPIRVRPTDLAEFIAACTRTGQRTKHRPQE